MHLNVTLNDMKADTKLDRLITKRRSTWRAILVGVTGVANSDQNYKLAFTRKQHGDKTKKYFNGKCNDKINLLLHRFHSRDSRFQPTTTDTHFKTKESILEM